ncbi:hypothetical protein BJ875DRAFT_425733 [Amylocarpus encephaloides]|uniref:NADAR domain-containing protein n=1 Tax=Amylocarpus encephaloides TaxID=45428 RepID=A0A9P7YHC1_9HELO|nr:hypothetical protein BJ875DRAFT_425733 [Amylocarpus encephaloides]
MAPIRRPRRSTKAPTHSKPPTNTDILSLTSSSTASASVFFWREYDHPYACFSQWYHLPFTVQDHPTHPATIFKTCEQYMMFSKAVLFEDMDMAECILQTTSPREQKALGRKVRGFDDDVWKKEREGIVEKGNWWKFMGGEEDGENGAMGERRRKRCREILLGTGARELVEASPRDRIWGVGFGEKNAESKRERWGCNLLGKCLMKVRQRIMEEEAKMLGEDKKEEMKRDE